MMEVVPQIVIAPLDFLLVLRTAGSVNVVFVGIPKNRKGLAVVISGLQNVKLQLSEQVQLMQNHIPLRFTSTGFKFILNF